MSTAIDSRINARLTGEDARRFKQLRAVTKQSASEVIREAVKLYHEKMVKPKKTPYEILLESGLIGSFEGPEDLSVNYKKYMAEDLAKKWRLDEPASSKK